MWFIVGSRSSEAVLCVCSHRPLLEKNGAWARVWLTEKPFATTDLKWPDPHRGHPCSSPDPILVNGITIRWDPNPGCCFSLLHPPSVQSPSPDKHVFSINNSWLGKESACSAGDPGSIPGSGGSPGEGNGNPLQYSCLENPTDRGAWQATVHAVSSVRHNWATKEREHKQNLPNVLHLHSSHSGPDSHQLFLLDYDCPSLVSLYSVARMMFLKPDAPAPLVLVLLTPWNGLSSTPGEGNGYLLQHSGLENSMDCIVHGAAKRWIWLSELHFHFQLIRATPASLSQGW